MTEDQSSRPPLPPFTLRASAAQKVRAAEDAWNSRDPERVSLAYSIDSTWKPRRVPVGSRGDREGHAPFSGTSRRVTLWWSVACDLGEIAWFVRIETSLKRNR